MSDSILDTITKIINSPPGQLAAGSMLAAVVWKFFERVEAVLTDDTKLRIAIWLLDLKMRKRFESWPRTFARIFDRVFGTKHLSLKCFLRSCLASYGALGLCLVIAKTIGVAIGNFPIYVMGPEKQLAADFLGFPIQRLRDGTPIIGFNHGILSAVVFYSAFLNVVPDYISLLTTRAILSFACKNSSTRRLCALLVLDLYLTAVIAMLATLLGVMCIRLSLLHKMPSLRTSYGDPYDYSLLLAIKTAVWATFHPPTGVRIYWYFPAFFTSAWLWLYAGSGLLLKAAHRFDLGFAWFNRLVDIEKKPLQSIGLVAGASVAVVYWVAMIMRGFLTP